jgi:hypothetical protein
MNKVLKFSEEARKSICEGVAIQQTKAVKEDTKYKKIREKAIKVDLLRGYVKGDNYDL